MQTLDGKLFELRELKGQPVVLNFWSVECPPCVEELPRLQKLWEKYRSEGLVVIGVAIDADTAKIRRFTTTLGVEFPTLLDPQRTVRERYELEVLPTTYFIARDHKLDSRILGAWSWQQPALHHYICTLVGLTTPCADNLTRTDAETLLATTVARQAEPVVKQ